MFNVVLALPHHLGSLEQPSSSQTQPFGFPLIKAVHGAILAKIPAARKISSASTLELTFNLSIDPRLELSLVDEFGEINLAEAN